MELFFIGAAVFIVVSLVWAVLVDRRRRREGLTGNPDERGKRTRIIGEQKGSEWGGH